MEDQNCSLEQNLARWSRILEGLQDLHKAPIIETQRASKKVSELEISQGFLGHEHGLSSRRNQFLEEFLDEWASEIHQNEVNSFLSRMGFPSLPSFSGVNPKDWINGIEVYFEVYPSMEIYQFSLVEDLLVGRAKEWVASWSFDGNYDDYWDEFVDALWEHFENEEGSREARGILLEVSAATISRKKIPVKLDEVVQEEGYKHLCDIAYVESDNSVSNDNKAVIDHSVQVDMARSENAVQANMELEFRRNKERFGFLKWGSNAFDNMLVVPPGSRIVHQVNLEYIGRVVFSRDGILYLDSVIATNSQTTMIDGLRVAGWEVGGIEAEATMLGQPMSMVLSGVVGFKLVGKLRDGVTATDLVLTVIQMLRKHVVADKDSAVDVVLLVEPKCCNLVEFLCEIRKENQVGLLENSVLGCEMKNQEVVVEESSLDVELKSEDQLLKCYYGPQDCDHFDVKSKPPDDSETTKELEQRIQEISVGAEWRLVFQNWKPGDIDVPLEGQTNVELSMCKGLRPMLSSGFPGDFEIANRKIDVCLLIREGVSVETKLLRKQEVAPLWFSVNCATVNGTYFLKMSEVQLALMVDAIVIGNMKVITFSTSLPKEVGISSDEVFVVAYKFVVSSNLDQMKALSKVLAFEKIGYGFLVERSKHLNVTGIGLLPDLWGTCQVSVFNTIGSVCTTNERCSQIDLTVMRQRKSETTCLSLMPFSTAFQSPMNVQILAYFPFVFFLQQWTTKLFVTVVSFGGSSLLVQQYGCLFMLFTYEEVQIRLMHDMAKVLKHDRCNTIPFARLKLFVKKLYKAARIIIDGLLLQHRIVTYNHTCDFISVLKLKTSSVVQLTTSQRRKQARTHVSIVGYTLCSVLDAEMTSQEEATVWRARFYDFDVP